jgi:hypothetical protein
MNSSLPTLRQVLLVVSHFGDFVVYYNELNEDFSRAIATCGDWESVLKIAEDEGFIFSEVAEIQFDADMVLIYLV